ncbi:hypothetical protein BDZ91DRAFT_766794 [Kalaharituber pfeilii]|nr:hypothetical protein BDZ91DRAFT_766794 [Kalaharituber pfeilii]
MGVVGAESASGIGEWGRGTGSTSLLKRMLRQAPPPAASTLDSPIHPPHKCDSSLLLSSVRTSHFVSARQASPPGPATAAAATFLFPPCLHAAATVCLPLAGLSISSTTSRKLRLRKSCLAALSISALNLRTRDLLVLPNDIAFPAAKGYKVSLPQQSALSAAGPQNLPRFSGVEPEPSRHTTLYQLSWRFH